MKKFVIIIALISFVFNSKAQKSFKDEVLLFPQNQNTTIKINGERKLLEETLLFNKSAEIEILTGKLSIITTDGKEISFDAGKSFHVRNAKTIRRKAPLGKVSKYLNVPSTYLPNLYSNNRSEFMVFPINSKVLDKSNVVFYFSEELPSDAVFKIFIHNTDSLVWQSKKLPNKLIGRDIPLKKGMKYCWKIYNGSNSSKGKIEFVDKKSNYHLKLGDTSSKLDYLNSFIFLIENEYRFDAVAVLLAARDRYPNSKLFSSLFDKVSHIVD